jgi:hypothetical protein
MNRFQSSRAVCRAEKDGEGLVEGVHMCSGDSRIRQLSAEPTRQVTILTHGSASLCDLFASLSKQDKGHP